MLEKCRYCGFEHEDLKHIFFRRNHVSNRVLPHCLHCFRRLYQVPYRPELDTKKEGNILAIDYKSALELLVIQNKIILAKDACKILKRKDISSTIHSLVKEGKIKTKLIDVRVQNNAIRALKVLFIKDIKEIELSQFEKNSLGKIANSSNIKKNDHKQLKQPSNQSEYIIINGRGGILIKTHKGNSVVNKNDIADLHEKLPFSIDNLINGNIHKFAKDIDYFIENEELLFTKSGYIILTESFNDKLSQRVKSQMVTKYFKYQNINVNNDTYHVHSDETNNQLPYENESPGYVKVLHDQIKILSEKICLLEIKLCGFGLASPTIN